MIFSRNLIEEYLDISKVSTDEIYKCLNSIGLEVDSLTRLTIPKGVVVGEVLEVRKHQEADKLSVCLVDVGSEKLQIVCGAKNVKDAKFVAVAKIGTALEGGVLIKKSTLRGEESCGMICSSTELGLPKIEDGILELDSSIGELKVGEELSNYRFFNDDIFEIDITPNRGDCLCIIGIARELSSVFEIPLKSFERYKEEENVLGIGRLMQLNYDGKSDSSLLYKVVQFENFKLPLSYKLRLAFASLLLENEIENLLEYATFITGVMTKAYSYSTLTENKEEDYKPTLTLRQNSQKLDTLYYKQNELSIIGVDQNSDFRPKQSDCVIIEASYIPPDILSKNMLKSEIKKDSRFYYKSSRGSNPELIDGIDLICRLIKTVNSGSTIYSGTHEITQSYKRVTLSIDITKTSEFIGEDVQKSFVVSILKNLGFKVDVSQDEKFIAITPPSFRHDILNIQDVTEEIVRSIGVDNIKSKPLMMKQESKVNDTYFDFLKTKEIRHRSSSAGFNETIHYVFTQKSRLIELGLDSLSDDLEIVNPITQELNTLRTTMLIGLLDSLERAKNIGKKSISFFEIGSIYNSKREEGRAVAFLHSGPKEEEELSNAGKPQGYTLFEFANSISSVIGEFELEASSDFEDSKIFHPYRSAKIVIEGKEAGVICEIHPSIIDDECGTFFAQIDFDLLEIKSIKAKTISKLLPLERDISVVISKEIPFSKIRRAINDLNIKNLKSFYPLDIYSSSELGESHSLTIRLTIHSDEKTLQEDDINSVVYKILEELNVKFEANLR